MRLKWIIALIVFIIASAISYEIVPQYIGKVYFKKAMRSFYGYDGVLEGRMWLPKNPLDLNRNLKRDYKDAISKFEITRKLGTEKLRSTTLIGFAYNELKQYETASKYFKEALQIAPHNDDAGGGLVESLIQLDKLDEAELVALDRLSYLFNSEDACLELAKIYGIKKDFKKAKEYADKCVELTDIKDRLDIMERVANRDLQMHITYELGDYEEVIKILNEILQLDPNRHGAYWNLAEVYDKLGDKEKALENWKKVISLNDPPNAVEIAKQRVQRLESELKPTGVPNL